ncbi:hypothetical protein ON753_23160 [Roseibium sp. DSM 29163]|uniref:Multiple sugar transport system ATP-binding protein n=1 Tax=Roseibium salinum TaxID=1604349 RepID=A0ABT3R851_9HYPH|nr:hypothetical protein [Roseibium sp. DSM 29163]
MRAVEFLGHEINLHIGIGEAAFVAVVPSDRLTAIPTRGETVSIKPIGNRIHLFDRHSEENISLG